jgi:hypothetical protein
MCPPPPCSALPTPAILLPSLPTTSPPIAHPSFHMPSQPASPPPFPDPSFPNSRLPVFSLCFAFPPRVCVCVTSHRSGTSIGKAKPPSQTAAKKPPRLLALPSTPTVLALGDGQGSSKRQSVGGSSSADAAHCGEAGDVADVEL